MLVEPLPCRLGCCLLGRRGTLAAAPGHSSRHRGSYCCSSFGAKAVDPKPIMKALPTLFGHTQVRLGQPGGGAAACCRQPHVLQALARPHDVQHVHFPCPRSSQAGVRDKAKEVSVELCAYLGQVGARDWVRHAAAAWCPGFC